MKSRSGFVSNSSSSSFIISEEDIEIVKKHGVKVYKVSDLIELLTPIVSSNRTIKKRIATVENKVPHFMFENIDAPTYPNVDSEYESLMKIENEYPACYITSAYDRDYACENEWHFPTYESDL